MDGTGKKGTHYERAFEDWLRRRRIPYVAVDQARKAACGGERIKSFDFIVYPSNRPKILADIKGRKFNYTSYQRGCLGQTWVTVSDVEGLACWEEVFGREYQAVFVFAYWLRKLDEAGSVEPLIAPASSRHRCGNPLQTAVAAGRRGGNHIHRFDQRDYVFMGVDLSAYRRRMRSRSGRWKTVYVPSKPFRQMARPFGQLVSGR